MSDCTQAKPVRVKGDALPAGAKRRLSDARNAWRKMTPEQRAVFLAWMAEQGLEVAS